MVARGPSKWRKVVASGLFMICAVQASAQGYFCKHIDITDGLSQPGVTCILSDSHGTIWIGTRYGLNRYRRDRIRTFMDQGEGNSLIHGNHVNMLFIDSADDLWVATDKGLSRYNKDRDAFDLLLKSDISSAFEKEGRIYFAGRDSLFVHVEGEGVFCPHRIEKPASTVVGIHAVDNEHLILADSEDGLLQIRLSDFTTRKIPVPLLEGCIIMDACVVDGNLYVATYKKGLFVVNLETGSVVRRYTTADSGLTNDTVLTIMQYGGDLWLGSDGGGICILNLQEGKISSLNDSFISGELIPAKSITELYRDSYGDIWAGSVRHGVFGIKTTDVRTYQSSFSQGRNSLDENVILSMWRTADGNLWFGTDGGGVFILDGKTDKIRQIAATDNLKISSLCEYDDRRMLLSVFNSGLYQMDRNTGVMTPLHFVKSDPSEKDLFTDCLPLLYNVDGDDIFIFAEHPYLYSRKNGKFSRFRFEGYDDKGLCLIGRNDDGTFLAYSPTGLFRISLDSLKVTQTYCDTGGAGINSAAFTPGRIWLGGDYGLRYLDLSTNGIVPIETHLFNRITQLKSEGNNLWIAADNLMFYHEISSGKYEIIDESKGFTANEILASTVLDNPEDEHVCFGGTRGFVQFRRHPRDMKEDDYRIELYEVHVDGHKVNVAEGKIRVPSHYSSLTLSANIPGTSPFRKNVFRYYIDGQSQSVLETWSDVLSLPAMHSGHHDVSVSYMKSDGSWSVPVKLLDIKVALPWFRRTWFIVLVFLVLCSVLFDVSRRIRMKVAAERKAEDVKRKEKEGERHIQFLVNLSHELRTPLTLAYTPLKRMISDDKYDRTILKKILFQLGRMEGLINMVLDHERLLSSSEALRKMPYDFSLFVKETTDDFRDEMIDRGIEFRVETDDTVGIIWFDRWKCQTVLSNLIMNAMKVTPFGKSVTVRGSRIDDSLVRVDVSDEGPGLKGVSPEKLFSRFGQGNTGHIGSGIGLAYSNSLVKLHGGSMGAENNPKGGADFHFEIPMVRDGLVMAAVTEQKVLVTDPEVNDSLFKRKEKNHYRVLFADDERDMREMIFKELSPYFKKVMTAENGRIAIEMIRQHMPDLIISDVMMPGMDGFDLCRTIKSDITICHIPIILLTAKSDADSVLTGYKAGADSYVSKPFDVDLLVTIAGNILRRREMVRERYSHRPDEDVSPIETTFASVDEQFMMRLDEYVFEHLEDESLDVMRLAGEMAMSRASLYNKVKVITGLGVAQYVDKIKMREACRLIRTTDLNVTEISEKLGFSSSGYFSSHFKRAIGVTPLEYRKKSKASASPDGKTGRAEP